MDEVSLQEPTLGWQVGNYSEFWGRTLRDGVELRLGTLNPSKSVSISTSRYRSSWNLYGVLEIFIRLFTLYIFLSHNYVKSTLSNSFTLCGHKKIDRSRTRVLRSFLYANVLNSISGLHTLQIRVCYFNKRIKITYLQLWLFLHIFQRFNLRNLTRSSILTPQSRRVESLKIWRFSRTHIYTLYNSKI